MLGDKDSLASNIAASESNTCCLNRPKDIAGWDNSPVSIVGLAALEAIDTLQESSTYAWICI